MFIDDLPMWGYLGEVIHEEFLLGKSIQGARVMLYPHLHFSIGFNNDQIVTANVTTDTKRSVDITDATQGQEVSGCFGNSTNKFTVLIIHPISGSHLNPQKSICKRLSFPFRLSGSTRHISSTMSA
jgi:hypothetical protein